MRTCIFRLTARRGAYGRIITADTDQFIHYRQMDRMESLTTMV